MPRANGSRFFATRVRPSKGEPMRSTSSRLLLAAAIVAAAPLASAPARAEGILDSVMGILGFEEEKPDITYRERAPLVVPPKMELRAPETAPALANPAWPKDPDVERARQIEVRKKQPGGMTSAERGRGDERASLVEMNGRGSGGRVKGLPQEPDTFDNSLHKRQDFLSVQQMRAQEAALDSVNPKASTGEEPSRRYLTDPPTGYRKPSKNAEFKAPKMGVAPSVNDGSPLSLYSPQPKEVGE